MGNLSHNTQNDNRHDDLMKDVRAFGREAATGADALPKLGLRVMQAAIDGVIDDAKNGDEDDAATSIYKSYVTEQSKKAIHEHTKNGVKANASKLRSFIKTGMMTSIDPAQFMADMVDEYQKTVSEEEKVKSAYPAYVAACREQLKGDTQLTRDELRAVYRKPESKEKTVESEIERAKKILDKLITGEGDLTCQADEVVNASTMLGSYLEMITRDDKIKALQEQAAALGVTITDAQDDQEEAA